MDINQQIKEKIAEIQRGESGSYDPVMLSELIIDLCSLYANLTAEIAEKEHTYQAILGMALDKDTTQPFNKVELTARRTNEYFELKKLQALEKACIQIIRASNKLIRLKEHEQETSGF